MVELFALLLMGLIIGLGYVIKYLIIFAIAPFYFGGLAIWSHSKSGVADKISKMDSDDFTALICDILKMQGYSNVKRYAKDMDIIFAEFNGKKIMCVCFRSDIGKMTTESINYVMQRAKQFGISRYVICYSIEITDAALNYAEEMNVKMADAYSIAGSYIKAKKQAKRGA